MEPEPLLDTSIDADRVLIDDDAPTPKRVAEAISAAPLKEALAGAKVWQIITCLPRLDSFNHSDLMQEIHSVLAEGERFVALDLTQNRFFSLNAIQLCVSLARDLAADDGCFALIGCSERTKRHFEVYGSLKQITNVRTVAALVSGPVTTVNVRAKASSQEAR